MTNTIVIDLRGAFLNYFRIDDLLCEDGIHPKSKGQNIITETFLNFSREKFVKGEMIHTLSEE